MIGILEVASAKIDRFGWDRMDDKLKDQLCGDWCDILKGFTLDEVRAGVADVFAETSGRLRSINEYQVKAAIEKRHALIVKSLPSQTEPDPGWDLSPEAVARRRALAAELLSSSTDGLRAPKPQSEAETQAKINAAKDEAGE